MSDLPLEDAKKNNDAGNLWAAAGGILLIVFAPAFLVWAVGLIHP
jgi:hypothetical protein